MQERTFAGDKIPKFQLNRKTRLVNSSFTSQAVEINNKLKCIQPNASLIAESGDIISYNKYSLHLKKIPCMYEDIFKISSKIDQSIEFVSCTKRPKKSYVKNYFSFIKIKIENFFMKYCKGE